MCDLEGAKNLAGAFAQHYYDTFDVNRGNLANLYVDVSILQFENDTVMGKDAIVKKLVGLPMRTVKHVVTTVDGQPTIDSGIIIHVLGQLKCDEDQPHSFSETFHLKKDASNPAGSFVILNQVFRLGIHHGV